MTAGRGFIAYTAIVFGKWNPPGGMAGAVISGFIRREIDLEERQFKIMVTGWGSFVRVRNNGFLF